MRALIRPPLQIGQRFGAYQIDALLGAGGMGTVYSATDRELRRTVAIKVVDRADAAARHALLQEARIAASLSHPGICSVHEIGRVGDQPFIVMEHIDGAPLSRRIPEGIGLPFETAVHYAMQIVDAVAHAHERGVVHCDLKSSNIMIGRSGTVKILDFGLATRTPPSADLDTETTRSEAPSGAGTVPYMAPEVLCGRRPDTRSDVWALGVLMYELVSGRRPFSGTTKYELAAAILGGTPAPLSTHVAVGFRHIVGRCLEKAPEDRYRSARGLASALDDLG